MVVIPKQKMTRKTDKTLLKVAPIFEKPVVIKSLCPKSIQEICQVERPEKGV
jgi:hypothetical protein